MVAGPSGDYVSSLKAPGKKYVCREQEWWSKSSDELSVLGLPHCCCEWHCWARVEQPQSRVVTYMYLHFSCQISYWAWITFQWFCLLKEIKGLHFFTRARCPLTLVLLLQIPVWFIQQAVPLNVLRMKSLKIQVVPSKKILLPYSSLYTQEINRTQFWEENQCYNHLPSLVKKAAPFSSAG